MPLKRRRALSPTQKPLQAGEHLKRQKILASASNGTWAWVGTQVTDPSKITQEHLLASCDLSSSHSRPFCANRYAPNESNEDTTPVENGNHVAAGELQNDIIVISDDEAPLSCNKKACKSNPNCLNYLGQNLWEDEDEAREMFYAASNLGNNPLYDSRDPDFPVGLKNLGATCYANAFLQVWFRDHAFRGGVYQCEPSQSEDKFEESPIFQLQVTFAALQESTQSVFNPAKLAESLQLRTTEQQDAQEFSKLFMSHLDAEFQKQSSPSLRSLIADQFQGKQVYGMICERCQYRSENVSDFYEIEINFESACTLQERISALLQPEYLSGDNQYLCAQCTTLQNATRYTALRTLPPVLHFSLLRFVYDKKTMERKKVKHAVVFPRVLDMRGFLGSGEQAAEAGKGEESDNLYELRGVLLHKGTSAYYGHYEAQVYDLESESWFQFNDETVTKIESLGDKRTTKVAGTDKRVNGARRSQEKKTRKRRRVESDDDIVEVTSPPATASENDFSSKDAYMLIYARRDTQSLSSIHNGTDSPPQVRQTQPTASPQVTEKGIGIAQRPPARAMEVIDALNADHDEACDDYQRREKHMEACYRDTRKKVGEIYRSWNVGSVKEDSVIVDEEALKEWLSFSAIAAAVGSHDDSKGHAEALGLYTGTPATAAHHVVVNNENITCAHGKLDPQKASSMKRIKKDAYTKIIEETSCTFDPVLSAEDVCRQCVVSVFTERLYQIEHRRSVSRFDACFEYEAGDGYWISQAWLKDWRFRKPQKHRTYQQDNPPDSGDFASHVRCEHGGLSLNTTVRRKITTEAGDILKDLFPSWDPLSTSTEPCPICEAMIHVSREDKRELRKRAEDEKAKLKHMYDNALNGNTALLEDIPCAIVPAHFMRSWRQWLARPAESGRPESVDNSGFICEHEMLVFDPNTADLASSITIIKRSDWECLKDLYPAGPLIAVEKHVHVIDGTQHLKFEYKIPICEACRQRRKSSFDSTEIYVCLLGQDDAIPTSSSASSDTVANFKPAHQTSLHHYTTIRQSKRLRQTKERIQKRRLTVTKLMTVKEIKVALQDELRIPTICQRIFYCGQELEDNAATVGSTGILSNDFLYLREENESDEFPLDSIPDTLMKRKEGPAFGGTVLGAAHDQAEIDKLDSFNAEKVCATCTFSNSAFLEACSMCGTSFT